jgi:DNA (cytosine-5)-methyltransferase 1
MENVTQVHGKKNKEHFDEWIAFLESKGYKNYWKDLNAKNFCIPQNRNRTFMVSVLGNYTYEFPQEFPLKKRLKDLLEDSVDEKFYISEKMLSWFVENTKKQKEKGNGFKFEPTNGDVIAKAVTTRAGGRMDDNFIEEQPTLIGGMQKNQAVKTDGISTTLTSSMGMGGGYVPMVVGEPLAYDEQNGYIRKDGTVGTLTTDGSSPKHNNRVVEDMRIRKLTPKECWRLMGFDDADFEKAAQFNSNSQLYKQAGNSIVVDVLYYIFGRMLQVNTNDTN